MSRSSFISAATTEQNTSRDILGDPWFPSVTQAEFDNLYRATGAVTIARQEHVVKLALASVCTELAPLRENASSFYELPHAFIGDETDTELHFKTAVYALAKSMLTNHFRSFDATAKGHDRADDLEGTTDNYLQESREAIRTLLGKPRITVSLV